MGEADSFLAFFLGTGRRFALGIGVRHGPVGGVIALDGP